MDKLVRHAIRMLEIAEGENDFFRNDAKRQADIARAVYDTILRVQILERKADRKTEPQKKMCANCKHIKKHNGKLADYVCDRKGSIVTNPYDKECDEMWERKDVPQTDGIIFKGNLKEGDYKLIKTTDGWVLEGEDIVYCGWERKDE